MTKSIAGDVILAGFFLVFSVWLMSKSFGYDSQTQQFRVARHEVGDFGLHLSLIRSFSWGDNNIPESPFYPGKPLAYHYAVDWMTAQMVRWGVRIDIAYNGISAIGFTILLYGLYKMTIMLFGRKRITGILSILLFILPSNLSFLDILKQVPSGGSFLNFFSRFPDYIHKGPFDGSIITIYTTLAPYLNQRHLTLGIAFGLILIVITLERITKEKSLSGIGWIFLGFAIGLLTRVHVLISAATGIMLIALLIGKNNKALLYVASAWLVSAGPYISKISVMRVAGMIELWNPGYLSPKPVGLSSFFLFWLYNLGATVLFIPVAFRISHGIKRRMLLGASSIFVLANTLQLSYRIEHNHSLINFSTILFVPFVAHILVTLWNRRGISGKVLGMGLFVSLVLSGVFNLMVVKNDYQLMVDDAPKNELIEWIRTETASNSIFIAKSALYDPITLAGRKNYLGEEYYVSVMGYDYSGRRKQVALWLSSLSGEDVADMKKQSIDYIALPKDRKNFPYTVDEEKVKTILTPVYQNDSMNIYEL